jgi:two-component system, response regulator PdtaR
MPQIQLSSINNAEWSADLIQILIADDDPEMLTGLSLGLRSAGFSTIDAADGASAMEICLQTPPSVAILDHHMPKYSGVEIAERLLPDKRFPIIFLSGHKESALVRRAVDAGAMAYLVKPVDTWQLIPIIWAVLRRFEELNAFRAENAKLTAALQSTRTIGAAVGVLMERLRLSEKDAFERLRQYARSQNAKLADLASGILARSSDFNEILNALASTTRQKRSRSDPA